MKNDIENDENYFFLDEIHLSDDEFNKILELKKQVFMLNDFNYINIITAKDNVREFSVRKEYKELYSHVRQMIFILLNKNCNTIDSIIRIIDLEVPHMKSKGKRAKQLIRNFDKIYSDLLTNTEKYKIAINSLIERDEVEKKS